MATKLTHETIRKQLHQREDEGNPSGTYFAVIVLVMLLGFVATYFWINNGQQVLESPLLQQGAHLTPHDAY